MPPPFGSGYRRREGVQRQRQGASIVPPPFGSGYTTIRGSTDAHRDASIVPPPFGSGYVTGSELAGETFTRFNCAAPFRERLLREHRADHPVVEHASIVPPPFGSGYAGRQCPL